MLVLSLAAIVSCVSFLGVLYSQYAIFISGPLAKGLGVVSPRHLGFRQASNLAGYEDIFTFFYVNLLL